MIEKGTPTQVWKYPNAENQSSYQSQYGDEIFEFGVLFEDGKTGVFGGKDANYPKFKVGELAHFEHRPSAKPGEWPDKFTFISERDAAVGPGGFAPPVAPPPPVDQDLEFGAQPAAPVVPTPSPAKRIEPATPFENPLKTRNIVRQTCVNAASRFCANRTEAAGAKGWQEIAEDMYKWIMVEEDDLPF